MGSTLGRKAKPRRALVVEPAAARRLLDRLQRTYPDADCELRFENAYQLIIATIQSAQCTDERVNRVTPGLFRRFPDAHALAAADTTDLEELIRTTGFYRSKARSLLGCSNRLAEVHGGEVPRSIEELIRLPGVGRKTANIVLGHAYGVNEGVGVDTHVRRVAGRLGLTASLDPEVIETDLMRLYPRRRWTRVTDTLIFHGRRTCHARRPRCGDCPVFASCSWGDKALTATSKLP